jgi:hypothetical protein
VTIRPHSRSCPATATRCTRIRRPPSDTHGWARRTRRSCRNRGYPRASLASVSVRFPRPVPASDSVEFQACRNQSCALPNGGLGRVRPSPRPGIGVWPASGARQGFGSNSAMRLHEPRFQELEGPIGLTQCRHRRGVCKKLFPGLLPISAWRPSPDSLN